MARSLRVSPRRQRHGSEHMGRNQKGHRPSPVHWESSLIDQPKWFARSDPSGFPAARMLQVYRTLQRTKGTSERWCVGNLSRPGRTVTRYSLSSKAYPVNSEEPKRARPVRTPTQDRGSDTGRTLGPARRFGGFCSWAEVAESTNKSNGTAARKRRAVPRPLGFPGPGFRPIRVKFLQILSFL